MFKMNKRYWAVAWISFGSGLPLLLVGSTLSAWFTKAGMSLLAIGALSLIGLPYLIKFLWSPLVDRVQWGRLGRRKGWLSITQLLVAFALFGMACFSPQKAPNVLVILAVAVAIFSSTQDIAVDAYRTDILDFSERGLGSAITNFSYRLAMLVAGSLALLLAAKVGWSITYIVMAALMTIQSWGSLLLPAPDTPAGTPSTIKNAVIQPIINFKQRFSKADLIKLAFFVIFYKFSDALALALNTTFLLRKVGFSLVEFAAAAKISMTAGMLLGTFASGLLLRRFKLYTILWFGGWLQILSQVGFVLLALLPKSIIWMSGVLFFDSLVGGITSVALVVFFMGLCDKRYTATQYSLLSALSALTRVLIGPVAAVAVSAMGWLDFYLLCVLFGLPGMMLLYRMRVTVKTEPFQLEPAVEAG